MIRVLIIDDSAVVRAILSKELDKYGDIEVVGTAADPYVAREKIARLRPDVLTLDLEMPRMDGLSFLGYLMRSHPLPVIIVSSLAPENSDTALRALALGAVDVIAKPGSTFSAPGGASLAQAIRVAATARPQAATQPDERRGPASPLPFQLKTTHKLLAIGASTGGTQAIETILSRFPATTPGTLIVQHMPEDFTRSFAERLDGLCQMNVREAKDGEVVVPGLALLAPGSHHMTLKRSGTRYIVKLNDDAPVRHHRPSVDVLFESVASNAGPNAVGAILTGMGADGARGLLEMKKNGAYTLAQDERSSVVFGMPKEAIKLGAVSEVLPLDKIAETALAKMSTEQLVSTGV